MVKNLKHIAIAGNIGSGKTTLTQMLSKKYKWIPIFEDIDENPYLFDFYQNMSKWSFNLQIYFLNLRVNQLLEIQNGHSTFIQDRTIYEDVFIFAACLKEMGLLSERDFNTYYKIYSTFNKFIKPPNLLIYLKSSVSNLVSQIQKRGRDYEENIRLDYLKRLNKFYDEWIDNYKESNLLIIDIDTTKFLDNKDAFLYITNKIEEKL